MKIALIHDSLSEYGGAEAVLKNFLRIFPTADVYTSFYHKEFMSQFFPELALKRLHGSWAQGTLFAKHDAPLQCLSPLIWRSFNLERYDLVVSNSSYLACCLVKTIKPILIHYLLSPPKNLIGQVAPSPFQWIIPYKLLLLSAFRKTLKRTPYIISDSKFTQGSLQKLFGINSQVVYPPVRTVKQLSVRKQRKYYISLCRLDQTKSLEVIIKACTKLNLPLKVVGKSADLAYEKYLYAIAGPTIEFLGFKTDQEVDVLYKHAIAYLYSTENEDFGIAPVEAMAHGVPVVAYYSGGLKETVAVGVSGVFYYQHTPQALMKILRKFKPERFSASKISHYAQKYSEERFVKEIKQYIQIAFREKSK